MARTEIGDVTITVRPHGEKQEEYGVRTQYRYVIESKGTVLCEGTDLHSGVAAPADPQAALVSLLDFLSAALESYAHGDDPTDPDSHANMFPVAVLDALDYDEVCTARCILEEDESMSTADELERLRMFVRQVAGITADGEVRNDPDAATDPYVMENDDAYDTLHSLISEAREIARVYP